MPSKKEVLLKIREEMLERKVCNEIDLRTTNRLMLVDRPVIGDTLVKKKYLINATINGLDETIKSIDEMIDEEEEKGEVKKI